MGLTLNTVILRTPTGLLKILELVLVLICLLLSRFGHKGDPLDFGNSDHDYLGIGIVVGYSIIVPSVFFTYLLGANLTFLELFINLIGGVLFITSGALTIQNNQYSRYDRTSGMALGCLLVATGIVFLIDFLFAIKNTRITVIQTRTVHV